VTASNDRWRTWSDPHFWDRLQGVQETESENHVGWNDPKKVGPSDAGGDFTTSKRWAESLNQDSVTLVYPWVDGDPLFGNSGRENQLVYHGPIQVPWSPSFTFPPFANSSESELTFWGTKAVALSSPTNPVANTAVALLEAYKDGLPHLIGHTLWQERLNLARQAGNEYLNYEFGWLPLLNDVQDFVKGVTHFDRLFSQLLRDSGKGVRRRHSFPTEVSYSESTVMQQRNVGGPGYVALQLLYNNGQVVSGHYGDVIRSRETTISRWFSGQFTYHLPQTFVPWQYGDFLTKARTILGLDLTPDVLWSLTPWSWAADWFSTAGDIIHNATAYSQYGLVLRYGYIMEHSVVRDTYTFVGDNGLPAGVVAGSPPPIVLTSEMKLRRRATPFGFGLNLSDLNDTQKAIIGALGLSRLR